MIKPEGVCARACVCACVCVRVCERERERVGDASGRFVLTNR